MKKKASFSDNIIRTVRLILGIAFVIMFIGGALLLFITEETLTIFYIKAGATLVAYVCLYFWSDFYLTKSFRKQFAPLDKLAYGLKNSSIDIIGDSDDIKLFARQLKQDMEKMDSLHKELNETRNNLDDIAQSNEKTINDSIDFLDDCKKLLVKSGKRQKRIKDNLLNISNSIDEILPMTSKVKAKQKLFNENTETIIGDISYNVMTQKEIKEDYNKVFQTFESLESSLKQSIEFIDSLFSELSVLQNIASQMNLYAMNTSIEASRSGIFNLNITNALDELKELSNKMQTKSDDIALLSIQSKNLLNLAVDQSQFCKEQNEESVGMINSTIEKFGALSEEIKEALVGADELIAESGKIIRNIDVIDSISTALVQDADYVLDSSDNIGNKLFELDKALRTSSTIDNGDGEIAEDN